MLPKKEVKMIEIKVLRPFYFEGKTVPANKVEKFEVGFAAEMVSAGKASYDLDAKPLKREKPVVKPESKK